MSPGGRVGGPPDGWGDTQALWAPQDQGGPGLDVVAIANLDVGSYNALESWSDDGRTLRQSWKPLGETMNLVSVARR